MITILKYQLDSSFKDYNKVILKLDTDVGEVVKIETSPFDSIIVTYKDVESISNKGVKKGWLYIYCDEKKEVQSE